MRLQARQHAEPRQHFERAGRAWRFRQLAVRDQLFVDLGFLGGAQAIRHLDHADAIDERLIVAVVLEGLPFRLVRMGEDDALERNAADILGADIIRFLRRRQQRMQHLDRRLEHFDEFENALGGAVEAARIGIGVGIVLAEEFELADIDLADQRGDVLIVLVARFGLGDADLAQPRWMDFHHGEFREIAAELVEPLQRPGRSEAGEAALRNLVVLLDHVAHPDGIEQTERTFEYRADFLAGFQHIDRHLLHQELQPFRERGFAAADGAEEIEDLLSFLQPLRRVPEIADDAFDRFFHAVEIREGRVDADRPVHEDATQTRIVTGVDEFGFADRGEHAFGGAGISQRVSGAAFEIVFERHFSLFLAVIQLGEETKRIIVRCH